MADGIMERLNCDAPSPTDWVKIRFPNMPVPNGWDMIQPRELVIHSVFRNKAHEFSEIFFI